MGKIRRTRRDEEQLLLWSNPPPAPLKKKLPIKEKKIPGRVTVARLQNIELLVRLRFGGDVGRLTQLLSASHAKTLEGLCHRGGSRRFDSKLARRVEAVCGLETGWLDLSHAGQDTLATKVTVLDRRARRAVSEIVEALLQP